MGKFRRDLFPELHCYFETQTILFTIVGISEKPSVPSSWCLYQGSLIPHRDNCDTRKIFTNSRVQQLKYTIPRSFLQSISRTHCSCFPQVQTDTILISYRSILTLMNLIFNKNIQLYKWFPESQCNNYKTYFSSLFYFHFRATHQRKL